jgi:glycosyltransferase involved in cell wall biosynthesis
MTPLFADRLRDALRGRPDAALARLRFAAQRQRLRLERLAGAALGRGPRVVATACWKFPIYSQTFVYQEVRQLVRKGYDVRFFYGRLDRGHAIADRFAEVWRARRQVEFHPAACEASYAWFMRRTPDRVDATLRALAKAAGLSVEDVVTHHHVRQGFAFARLVGAFRPAYVHSYFFYEGTLFAWMASRLLDLPRGVSCYADHVLDDYRLKVVALHLRECRIVIATSQRVRSELLAIEPSAAHVLVKPNAEHFPPRARAEPSDGPLRLISVSRIAPKKGLLYLVEAVALVRRDGLDVVLHILGEDDESEEGRRCGAELRDRVRALGLEHHVHFEGRRTQTEVSAFFARAHIFIAPFVETEAGDKDGVPTALLEAMASGLPVVVTDAGSIPEVVTHGRDGVIVPQRDAGALAAAVAALCRDAARRHDLGRRAAETIRQRFDVSRCETAFHDRLARLLSGTAATDLPHQPDPDPA